MRLGFEYRLEQDNDNLAGADRPTYAWDGMWAFANDTPIYEAITADPRPEEWRIRLGICGTITTAYFFRTIGRRLRI